MKKFISAELADKSNPDVAALFSIGFEYMFACVAESYSKTQRYKSITEFNERNNLTKPLVSSYPFFIALSNGHGHSLFNLFGEFYSYTFGPVSESIIDLIDGKQFTFLDITEKRFKFKPAFPSFDKLKKAMQEYTFRFKDGQSRFSDVYIRNDEGENEKSLDEQYFKRLFLAIENGMTIISEVSNNLFFDGSVKRITDFSIYFSVLSKRYSSNTAELIRYDQIEEPLQRAIYTDKPILAS